MSFNKKCIFILAILSLGFPLLTGCSDDSTTNPQTPSGDFSGTVQEGAFRVARPATYTSKNGINYYTYYWGKCTVKDGIYTWDPMGDDDIFAYVISQDSLKVYYRSTDEFENDSPLDPDVDFFMYGGNLDNTLWGYWNSVHCGIRNGVYTCGKAQLYNMAYEFKQDSVINYMTIDPNYVFITEAFHDILESYFHICPYDYGMDEDSDYLQDILEKGIVFSNQSKNKGTVTISGQSIDVEAYGVTYADGVHYKFKVSSNGVTCSDESTFGYVNKPEYCSEAYKDYLIDDDDDNILTTFYLRGRGNQVEYENCLKSIFSSNPAYKPYED